MKHESRLAFAFLLTFVPVLLARTTAASPQSGILGWGDHVFDSHWNEEPFVSVSAGECTTLALRANGTIAMWGRNAKGECLVPALLPGLTYTAVSAGAAHALALRSDGKVLAWGDNQSGQCDAPNPPSGVTYVAIAAGIQLSIGLRSDGNVVAWGYGPFGAGSVPPLPAGLSYVAIAAAAHGLALRSDGAAIAWGDNANGQCNVPPLPPGVTWVRLAATGICSLGLRSDGVVVGWGNNAAGQFDAPPLPPGLSYVDISLGQWHALALRSDGAVVEWGDNSVGQLGVPALPPGLSYVAVEPGFQHSAALRSDGIVVSWGQNADCQCNVPRLPQGVSFVQCAASPNELSIYQIPPIPGFYGALRGDGQLVTWGAAPSGGPPLPPPGVEYVKLATGMFHCAALRSDGLIDAWGDNSSGACNVPAPPPGLAYVDVSAGGAFEIDDVCTGYDNYWARSTTVALRSDGRAMAWGTCALGQCSIPAALDVVEAAVCGTSVTLRASNGLISAYGAPSGTALALPPGLTYVEVAVGGGTFYYSWCGPGASYGESHTLARRSDGSVVAWGANSAGQAYVPALPAGLSYVEVAAGLAHSVARRSDGSVVAWGDNTYRQCTLPVLAPGLAFVEIEAGAFSTIARYEPAPACGSVSRYCWPASPNSASAQGASLTTEGCPGLTANDLVLDVSGLPPSRMGMFLYGTAQQQVSFGNGWGCVAGGIQRVYPTILSSPSGTVNYPVDLTQFPYSGSAHAILAGSAWNFQYWFRDPGVPPSQFNLSDALHISFAP